MLKVQMIGKILVAAAVLATVSFVFSSLFGFLPGIPTHPSTVSVTNRRGLIVYYKLCLQWPPSACSDPEKTCKAEHKSKEKFTIHGLWPQREGDVSVSPYYFDDTCLGRAINPPELKYKHIKVLEKKLTENWPGLLWNTDFAFWDHEWKEHGKCSEYAEDPYSYFKTALDTHDGFVNLLKDLKIEPGNWYKAGKILEDAKEVIGFYPQIVCNEVDGQRQLLEIRFCYDDPPFGFRDCPCRLSRCQYETYIFLPSASPSTVRNDMEPYKRSEL